MNKDNKEPEYPAELESQFILRLPKEPAKALRELLRSGDSLKNRLTIQIENDMRNGEVQFDHWAMHGNIIDLPTIIESLKTIDNKSFYKTADICQMMICKEEPDQTPSEEDLPSKNKKKDPTKVEKKYLWPHGITPPTKNVRKRRFRKTLKKKYVEAPEIEKEVKRLLRADNEACHLSWEVVQEDDESLVKSDLVPQSPAKADKKQKAQRKSKKKEAKAETSKRDSNQDLMQNSSNVVDIFGGAVSDSDAEEDRINSQMEKCHMSPYSARSSAVTRDNLPDVYPVELDAPPILTPTTKGKKKSSKSSKRRSSKVTSTVTSSVDSAATVATTPAPTSTVTSAQSGEMSSLENSGKQSYDLPEDLTHNTSHDLSQDNMTFRIEKLRVELEELKQRRQRTRHEISGMENMALRQRFQDILHTLNQDVMYKEMEYQGLITLQNSEDI